MQRCTNCNMEHDLSQEDHALLCEAKTCDLCLTNQEEVIPKDSNGERVCADCIRELDKGGQEVTSVEEDEDGIT